MPDGRVLTDSWQIGEEAFGRGSAAASCDPELKKFLDEEFGILTRQSAYATLLKPSNYDLWSDMCLLNSGPVYSILWRLGMGRKLTSSMVTTFAADDPEATNKCSVRLEESFKHLEKWLPETATPGPSSSLPASTRAPYLGGAPSPGLADFALASLAAPVLHPARYCEGRFAEILDQVVERDQGLRERVEELRNTPVGRHVIHMYEKHR
jgi:hypothetical protein